MFRVFLSQQRTPSHLPVVAALLQRWLAEDAPADGVAERAREVLDRLVTATQLRFPAIGDLARSARFRWFEAPIVEAAREEAYAAVREQLAYLSEHPDAPDYEDRVDALVASPEPLVRFLAERIADGVPGDEPLVEVLARRHYREHDLVVVDGALGQILEGRPCLVGDYALHEARTRLLSTVAEAGELAELGERLAELVASTPEDQDAVVDLYLAWPDAPTDADEACAELGRRLAAWPFFPKLRRVATMVSTRDGALIHQFTFRPDADGAAVEDGLVRGMHPMVGRRLDLWRLREFTLTRLPSPDDVLLFHAVAPGNEADQRIVALAQVRELSVVRDAAGHVVSLPAGGAHRRVLPGRRAPGAGRPAERQPAGHEPRVALRLARHRRAGRGADRAATHGGPADRGRRDRGGRRPGPDRPAGRSDRGVGPVQLPARVRRRHHRQRSAAGAAAPARRLRAEGAALAPPRHRLPLRADAGPRPRAASSSSTTSTTPVASSRSTGRPAATRPAWSSASSEPRRSVTPTGMARVVLLGDPTRSLGALAEPECLRVVAALDLAAELGVPVEWFALSSGARISMDNGTENMDWVARALRRIVEFTQDGGEINIVVTGINVGAQPYWNAEATMLMHTKGILVMTPDSAMVLTGKQSLDYSGGVSAEDNFGIGGYDRVMGPNGQAQYWAPDLAAAVDVLMAHYDHAYVAPGEATPRPAPTSDPRDRDVRDYPHDHPDSDFRTVGDIFSPARTRSGRSRSTSARCCARWRTRTTRRWSGGRAWRTPRRRSSWTPTSAAARSACSASSPARCPAAASRPATARTPGRRERSSRSRRRRPPARSTPPRGHAPWSCWPTSPGSTARRSRCGGCSSSTAPRSGGRSSTSTGPIVFCVVSRYHGGAFVVFSKTLNDRMQVLAVEGSYASVIGGAPAAGVVFTGEVDRRTGADPRVTALERRARRRRPARAARAPSWPTCGRRCVRRSSARSRRSSTPCTPSSERSPSARWTPSSPPPSSAPR